MTLSDTATAQLWETFRAGGGAELIRDAVELVLQELIEAEAAEAIGAGRYERSEHRRTERKRAPRPLVGHPGGGCGAEDPQAEKGQLLSVDARASPAHRQGAVRGDHGGLCGWGVNALSR